MSFTVLQLGETSTLAPLVTTAGGKLFMAESPTHAQDICAQHNIALAFVHSSIDIPAFFSQLNAAKLAVPVVVFGPANPVQNAVKAIRLGAIEYLAEPLDPPAAEALILRVKPAENTFTPIHGDAKTADLLAMAKQFAQSGASVLLRGESGTGKEIFSQYIHTNSPRSEKNFVAVNCAAIPEALLESELFGHEKGAFSGAVSKRVGKFQQADGGTLLLDEISEMDLTLQAKLLRAIQERVIDPVGSDKPVPIDIRLIATTNRQLEDYVAEGSFREDLYFRLNVVMLEVPPLRERTGDIPPLAAFFAQKYAEQNGKNSITISAEALEKLTSCYWKGNVRELENTIHRAILMMGTADTLQPEHIVISPMSLKMMDIPANNEQAAVSARDTLGLHGANPAAAAYGATAAGKSVGMVGGYAGQQLADVERDHILSTLTYCRGNRELAANVLGITIKILKEKLETYDAA